MTSEEAYIVLGIENQDIDLEELKRIFRDAAHLSHPDSNPENVNARAKFEMIQEAYRVLQIHLSGQNAKEIYKKEKACERYEESTFSKLYKEYQAKSNMRYDSSEPKNYGKKKHKDQWDYYAEADRRFAEQRREETSRRVKEAMFSQRMREEQDQKSENTNQSIYETNSSEQTTMSGGAVATDYNQVVNLIQNLKTVFFNKANFAWDYFMSHDLIFDGIMLFVIALSVICKCFITIPMLVQTSLIWIMGVLISRRITKWSCSFIQVKIFRVLLFLACLEIQVELYKFFLF